MSSRTLLLLQELKSSSCILAFVLYELLRRCIISYCGGLYYIQNLQVTWKKFSVIKYALVCKISISANVLYSHYNNTVFFF